MICHMILYHIMLSMLYYLYKKPVLLDISCSQTLNPVNAKPSSPKHPLGDRQLHLQPRHGICNRLGSVVASCCGLGMGLLLDKAFESGIMGRTHPTYVFLSWRPSVATIFGQARAQVQSVPVARNFRPAPCNILML